MIDGKCRTRYILYQICNQFFLCFQIVQFRDNGTGINYIATFSAFPCKRHMGLYIQGFRVGQSIVQTEIILRIISPNMR